MLYCNSSLTYLVTWKGYKNYCVFNTMAPCSPDRPHKSYEDSWGQFQASPQIFSITLAVSLAVYFSALRNESNYINVKPTLQEC